MCIEISTLYQLNKTFAGELCANHNSQFMQDHGGFNIWNRILKSCLLSKLGDLTEIVW